jgi:hypothetical protein
MRLGTHISLALATLLCPGIGASVPAKAATWYVDDDHPAAGVSGIAGDGFLVVDGTGAVRQ